MSTGLWIHELKTKKTKSLRFSECCLEHCCVNSANAVETILFLIFIAAILTQLFLIRRLKRNYETQKEIVGLLLKGLYLLSKGRILYLILHRLKTKNNGKRIMLGDKSVPKSEM